MTVEAYEWSDASKLELYKKNLRAYFLIPFFISLAILIMMLQYFISSFSTFSNDTFIAGFLLFCIIVFMFGPYLGQRYKIKRDAKGFRIAYNNRKFLLISEEDNSIKETFPIETVKAIFIDYASVACFIAIQSKEVDLSEKIYSTYNERNRNFMLTGDIAHALRRDWAPLAYIGGVYSSINLFYSVSKAVSGARLIKIKELEKFMDTLQVFEKTTSQSKYYGTALYCIYKNKNEKDK